MHDRRLERQLRRINGEGSLLRSLCAAAALGCIATALLASGAPATGLVPALAAVVPAGVWLRRYNRARPFASGITHDLAIGAFLGALIAALTIDTPASLHAWLQMPAERAAPAAVAVLMAAMIEDLARESLEAVRTRR